MPRSMLAGKVIKVLQLSQKGREGIIFEQVSSSLNLSPAFIRYEPSHLGPHFPHLEDGELLISPAILTLPRTPRVVWRPGETASGGAFSEPRPPPALARRRTGDQFLMQWPGQSHGSSET